MKTLISEQIQQAFSTTPTLDGVLHGRRKIKQGKHGSRSSLFYSAKNQAFIPVESRLERDFCYQLEADNDVEKYRTQALEIAFRKHALYPDFLILNTRGVPCVKEVKSFAFVNTYRNTQNANYLSSVFARASIQFSVITERDCWSGSEKYNRFMMYDRGGRMSPSDEICRWVADMVAALDVAHRTIGQIRRELARCNAPSYMLEAAIFRGYLKCDVTRMITSQTMLEVSP